MELIKEYLGYLPSILIGIFLIIGLYQVFFGSVNKAAVASQLSYRLSEATPTDKYLIKAGVPLNTMQYKALLYIISGTIAAGVFLFAIVKGIYIYIITGIAVAVILAVLLYPTEKLFGVIKSPFSIILENTTKSRRKKLDSELFNSTITLKNLAIVKEDNPISADTIYEQLMENSNKLKPIYAEMLSMYRTGKHEEAFDFFSEAIGTKLSRTFASTLSKIDMINPAELTEQVTVLQESVSEKRLTEGLKKAERNGVISITVATAICFVVLLNFMFVVVMMDALNMIEGVF